MCRPYLSSAAFARTSIEQSRSIFSRTSFCSGRTSLFHSPVSNLEDMAGLTIRLYVVLLVTHARTSPICWSFQNSVYNVRNASTARPSRSRLWNKIHVTQAAHDAERIPTPLSSGPIWLTQRREWRHSHMRHSARV